MSVDTGQLLGGRYLLGEVIGRGAMGQVFAATDNDSGDQVAVKVLRPELVSDPEARARFLQERQILTSISGAATVRVTDLVSEGETLAIVMELVNGQDLRRYLRAQGTLPPAEAVSLAVQLLHGLAAVHAAGVVHRDIKPENLLLDNTSDGVTLKVTDFGVARLSYGGSLTKLSSVIGTPEYMAPELAEAGSAGPAADVYSAGVVLYEMLAGRTPFAGGPPMAVLRRHADMAPPPVPGLPAALGEQLAQLLAKDPAARPASAADAAEALSAQAAELAALPALPPMPEPAAYQRAAAPADVSSSGSGATMTVVRPRDRGAAPAAGAEPGPAGPGSPGAGSGVTSGGRRRRTAVIGGTAVAAAAVIAAGVITVPHWLHPSPVNVATNNLGNTSAESPTPRPSTPSPSASSASTPSASAAAVTKASHKATRRPAATQPAVNDPVAGAVPAGSADNGNGNTNGGAVAPAAAPASARPSTHVAAPRAAASTPAQAPPPVKAVPKPVQSSSAAVPVGASYADTFLATNSTSVIAIVYFGQLSSIVGALSGRVTFNTAAGTLASEAGRCASTVVFSAVTNPTGAVYALNLGSGWGALEGAPSQATENQNLHQQLVTPPSSLSAGESWQPGATLAAGTQQATSVSYSLQYEGSSGSGETWLFNGHTVTCDAT